MKEKDRKPRGGQRRAKLPAADAHTVRAIRGLVITADREQLQQDSFVGFLSIGELKKHSLNQVPNEPGIYVILRESDREVEFLKRSTGGHFKGKDPTVSVSDLRNAWVNDTSILYIGKAGRSEGSATLRSRLRQYFLFGGGSAVGHWGGRYIWQLADADGLVVCWRTTSADEARMAERQMLAGFQAEHGKLPFANLNR